MKTRVLCLLMFFLLVFSASVFAGDLAFNLSVNPEADGSAIIGNLNIAWGNNFSSLLNVYSARSGSTDLQIEGFGDAIQSQTTTRLQIDLLPASYDMKLGSLSLGLSAGLSFLNLVETTNAMMNDKDGSLLVPAGQYVSYYNDRNAIIFSPRLGLSLVVPLVSVMRISYTGFVSPIYYLSLDQEMKYSFLTDPSKNNISRWSSPYLDQRFSLDFFSFARGVLEHTYQRLDFQTMDWAADGESLVGVDDVQDINELRLGLELLYPVKAGAARIKGGVYWLNKYISSSYWGSLKNDQKIEFRFGIEG